MKMRVIIGVLFAAIFIWCSCSGPRKSLDEENVLSALSNIQKSLEANVDYEQFSALLLQAKVKIDILKSKSTNNPCFLGAVDRCYSYYFTGGKAWKKKMEATDEARKNDMDLTLSVLQSQAALSIQMANNCYKN